MSDIYIVMGSTGEYSDHREWPIAAYRDEERAREHVLLATRSYRALFAEFKAADSDLTQEWYTFDQWLEEAGKANAFDPAMQTDYTGTRYSYFAVPLRGKVKPMLAKEARKGGVD